MAEENVMQTDPITGSLAILALFLTVMDKKKKIVPISIIYELS